MLFQEEVLDNNNSQKNLDILDKKLLYIMDVLNDREIRSILFVYLHEVINRFAFEDFLAYH